MLLARANDATETLYLAAMPESVSPGRTVTVLGLEALAPALVLLLFVEVAEDEDPAFAPAERCSRCPGMIQRPPSRSEFAETRALTLVRWVAAMS